MQKYPLSVKIGRTTARIMEFYRETKGNVYISFSGGKDSTVLLHIVRQLYPDALAVFCDTRLEYPEVRQFVKSFPNVEWLKPNMSYQEVVKTHGYPVVSKELARTVYYARRCSEWAVKKMDGLFKDGDRCEKYQRYIKYKYLLDAPFPISSACCDEMKKKPARRFETLSGLHPITGQMAEESYLRQTAWLRNGCNILDSKRTISNPMSFWTEQDILLYLKLTGIPYAPVYGEIISGAEKQPKLQTTGCRRTGCFACMFGVQNEKEPNRFQQMRLTHPKLHAYCIDTLRCGEVLEYMGVKY